MTVARAVEGIEQEAIIRACQAFTDGVVDGQSLDYAPAIPRFRKECLDQQAALRHSRVKIEPPAPQPDLPLVAPEKMQALTDALAGKRTIESVIEQYQIKTAAE